MSYDFFVGQIHKLKYAIYSENKMLIIESGMQILIKQWYPDDSFLIEECYGNRQRIRVENKTLLESIK